LSYQERETPDTYHQRRPRSYRPGNQERGQIMTQVSIDIQHAGGCYIPAGIGSRELVWQAPVRIISVNGTRRLKIEGDAYTVSSHWLSEYAPSDVSCDVPADARGNHAATVAFWRAELARLERTRQAATPPAGAFLVEGEIVLAPRFTADQFLAHVARAKAAQLRTTPAAHGGVMIASPNRPAVYHTSRETCDCAAGLNGRNCYHRDWAVYIADVAGIDPCRYPVVGVDACGTVVAGSPSRSIKSASFSADQRTPDCVAAWRASA
jgi:hypothetical protein